MYMYTSLKIQNMIKLYEEEKERKTKDMKEKIKNKKIVISMLVVLVLVLCCIGGYVAKIKYDQKQEKIRLEKIEKKNKEIQSEYDQFEKEEDRANKLAMVKTFSSEIEKYKKSEEKFDICEKEYENKLALMKKYFSDDYDTVINNISTEIGDLNNFGDKEKLASYVTTLTDLKTTIQNEYENYNMIDKDKFDSYNTTIDTNIQSYNDRISAIQKAEEEAEAARKKAEEEAAAAAAEEAARQAQSSSKSNSGKSSGSKSSSGSSSKSSGSKKSSGGSSSSGSSGNWSKVWGDDSNDYWYRNDDTGDTYDQNGNHTGNIYDWY